MNGDQETEVRAFLLSNLHNAQRELITGINHARMLDDPVMMERLAGALDLVEGGYQDLAPLMHTAEGRQ